MKYESGISSIVGVVLLLVLVVVTAATLGFILSSATYDAVDSMPNVIFTTSEDPYMLYNGGGDILYKDKLEFYAGGYNVNSIISIDGNDNWIEWHTGQAITISYGIYTVSDLGIVARDSYGKEYLVYMGPTADPVPSGKPVPDVTPAPTPTPVRPDASFTLTSVNPGENVLSSILPSSLINKADYFVVMKATEHWFFGRYYTYDADVKFTATEDNLQYAWSVLPSVYIDNAALRSPTMTFDESGLYNVTLTVTNTTSGLSNSSTQTVSVRYPGITVMTWVTPDKSKNTGIFAYHGDYYYPQWTLAAVNSWGNKGYRMEIYVYYSLRTVNAYVGLPFKDTWYHVTGTYDQGGGMLNIFVDGSLEQYSNVGSGTLTNTDGETIWGSSNKFTCAYSYEIPFAMTELEIQEVYNAEKDLLKS
jgi:hypothetical protein